MVPLISVSSLEDHTRLPDILSSRDQRSLSAADVSITDPAMRRKPLTDERRICHRVLDQPVPVRQESASLLSFVITRSSCHTITVLVPRSGA